MRLLDVKAVLDREAHIQQADPEREILKELDDKGTRYAILSHRWGDEVGYEEMTGLMNMEERKRDQIRQRNGYQKIIKSCKQASKDGYELLWIDTCCIDKWSSSELSEAINSMYRWYQNAQVCYAYLNDVDESVFPAERNCDKFSESDGWPEWFMRGWTLQELIAPKQVEFFNKDWAPIGNKRHLAPTLEDITQIPWEVLRDGLAAKRLSVAQVMSWAAKRKTTRVEDRAYSLMGLFRVNMPMLYGEGKKAFQRLQLEIIRVSSDHSIFAWNPSEPRTGSVLAEDPSDFRSGSLIKIVKPDEFIDSLMALIEWNALSGPRHSHHRFRKILSNPIRWCRLAWLRWRARAISHRLRTISVTSSGIQVCLPVIPSRDSPSHLRAILPCGYVPFIIDLVSSGSNFERTSATARISAPTTTYPEFKTLCLTYHRDANETHREFALDDKYASYHGFTRCGTYPCEFTGDTVALSSLADDLIIIVYANDHNGSRFAVGLGYHLGQGWVHAVYDGCSPTQKDRIPWSNFAHGTFWRMWNARAEHVQSMPKQEYDDERRRNDHFIKHVHIPRSIWAARVVWGRWEMENFKIMVDVEQCPGCCDGPRGWATTCNEHCGFDTPGFMDTTCYPYLLRLDGWWAQFAKCSGPRIVLGDYGEYSDGNFKCTGNIFEDMRTLGNIDPTESVYQPLVCHVSGSGWLMRHVENHIDLAMVCHTSTEGNHLALRQPKGLRLPENGHFELLLKELAIRLAGKHLVISVIQCSSLYGVDIHGEARDSGDDSTIDGDNHSMQPRILTPLYIVVSPQVWQREMPCVQRREQFKSIREHFYALVNIRQPTGVEVRHKSAVHRKTARTSIAHLGWHQNRQKKDGAIRFFSEMFCLHHLRNYVGKIFFFERLPSIMKSDSVSEVSTGSAEGLFTKLNLFVRKPTLQP
ncbi:heterokaryon incompatibility protein-domain-containing protein [Pisolithus orientalis]|uniref:heterokaryon incompatibility protein-domain-containing protein n=1 Tax=Pisolithus orientalis TaxID=936130 RepID=UPI0022251029|nr:heterokaryon incompatibility protein-domain-containing protein [Pisolithus orientalis]KAI5986976.1 heterokaryon incompatibility protein-domain-containing protein [Pisolithus orientalis]